MLRGFYTSASGIVTQEKRLNTIANNIANSSTAGYKKDNVTMSTFGEHIAVRMNTYNQSPLHRIGNGAWMQVTDEKHTSFMQGTFDYTGRSLDMALQGEGFFVIGTPEGNRLTRDGQFAVDEDGYLVLPERGRVQGQRGDIRVGTSKFVVSDNGTIYLMPQEDDDVEEGLIELDRLAIALPEDYIALEKDAAGLYVAEDYTLMREDGGQGIVMHEYVERSNVDMTEEMTRMLAAQRSLQSASQLVKMYDEMSDQGNRSISTVK